MRAISALSFVIRSGGVFAGASIPCHDPVTKPGKVSARLGTLGEERTARVGDVLYRIGDRTYPFIAILEGEAAIIDA